MCGLVGFINNEKNVVAGLGNTMSQLLFIDMLRGQDATGYAGILKEDNTKHMHYKRALRSPDFLETQGWASAYKDINKIKYFIGHNRKATQGAAHLDWNAHPFHRNNIILAHNGSLRNEYNLQPRWNDICDTDSELLAHLLNKQTVEELIPKVNGAFALTWYDARDGTMNFIRNDERPLHMATIKDKNLMIWASEESMLQYVLERNNLEPETIESIVEGWHIKMKDDVRDWEETEIPLFKPPASRRTYPNYESNRSDYPRKNNGADINIRENQAVKSQNKLLSKYNLNVGQWIRFSYLAYNKYAYDNATTGQLNGIPMCNEKIAECYISCPSIDPTKFDMRYTFRGKITRMIDSVGGGHPTIQLAEVEEVKSDYDSGVAKAFAWDSGIKVPKSTKSPIILPHDKSIDIPDKDETEVIKNIAGKSVSPGEQSAKKKYRGPDGQFFRFKDFRKLVSDGCMHCGGPIVGSDAPRLLWTNDCRAICPECVAQHRAGAIDLSGNIQQ